MLKASHVENKVIRSEPPPCQGAERSPLLEDLRFMRQKLESGYKLRVYSRLGSMGQIPDEADA